MRSCNCSKLAPPSASSSMAVSSVVFPNIISVDNFFSMISLLFSSICVSKLRGHSDDAFHCFAEGLKSLIFRKLEGFCVEQLFFVALNSSCVCICQWVDRW